jgi:DHA2 family multidrug resistance protein-like MFS transporter
VMKRVGTKAVVTGGMLLMSAGFLVAATTGVDTAYWGRIIIAMILMAAGLGLTASPATEAIMGALPPDKAGVGSAVNDTTREVGGTLGVAVVGSVLSSAYGSHVVSALTRLGVPGRVAAEAGLRVAAAAAAQQAFVTGVHQGSLVAAGATAGAALVALIFLPARARNVLPAAAAEPENSAEPEMAASVPASEVCATRT